MIDWLKKLLGLRSRREEGRLFAEEMVNECGFSIPELELNKERMELLGIADDFEVGVQDYIDNYGGDK